MDLPYNQNISRAHSILHICLTKSFGFKPEFFTGVSGCVPIFFLIVANIELYSHKHNIINVTHTAYLGTINGQ